MCRCANFKKKCNKEPYKKLMDIINVLTVSSHSLKGFIEQLQQNGFSHNSTFSFSWERFLKTFPSNRVSRFSDKSNDLKPVAPLI